MSINPADSQIFGTLYGTDETRALFSDRAHLQFMLDVEAALARAESKLGLVPESVADAIGGAARAENLRIDYVADSTRRVGYPVVALVKELGRVAGDEAARYIHLGATTQDILDTALVLQLQRAFAILRRDLIALARSSGRSSRALSRRPDCRPHPSAARRADHVRSQVRDLGLAICHSPRAIGSGRKESSGRPVRRRGGNAGGARR